MADQSSTEQRLSLIHSGELELQHTIRKQELELQHAIRQRELDVERSIRQEELDLERMRISTLALKHGFIGSLCSATIGLQQTAGKLRRGDGASSSSWPAQAGRHALRC